MKYTLITLSIFLWSFTNAQEISCSELFEIVTTKYDSKRSTSCYTSSMLVKVDYYRLNDAGFVVAYIKENDYDFNGRPYVFCGISQRRWNSFTSGGIYEGSWGKAFHKYIRDYTCDCY